MTIVVRIGRLCLAIHLGWLQCTVKITLVKD